MGGMWGWFVININYQLHKKNNYSQANTEGHLQPSQQCCSFAAECHINCPFF